MIRLLIKTIQILLALIIFWIAAAFGSALFFAFTSPYPSCTIGQYVPCSLQLEYFFGTFVISLIVNPFMWFFMWVKPSSSLKDLPLILSGITCGTISVICFFKLVEILSDRSKSPDNTFRDRKRQQNVKRKYFLLTFIVTIILGGAIDLHSKLTTNSNSAGYLPKKLGNVQVLTSNVQLGFIEGCDLYIFQLESSVSNKIKEIGITYFESDNKLRSDSSLKSKNTNPYSQWKSTPVPKDSYSWGALGCGKETDGELIRQIRNGMESASGYYIMTRNKEGVIVVLPNENLAAFLYYG